MYFLFVTMPTQCIIIIVIQDLGKDGSISNRDMRSFVKGHNQDQDTAMAGDLLEALEKDPDGSLSMKEFRKLFGKLSNQKVFNDSGAQEISSKCEEVVCV